MGCISKSIGGDLCYRLADQGSGYGYPAIDKRGAGISIDADVGAHVGVGPDSGLGGLEDARQDEGESEGHWHGESQISGTKAIHSVRKMVHGLVCYGFVKVYNLAEHSAG